ncbi:MAG TPA: hypothetical protein VHU81_17325 [Thermoanaerobaculia bacterium]|jgi:hypothetical protein|nr:hypothetical protein [Thermoanaerobaculia bacterium]
MKKRSPRKLELSKETLNVVAAGTREIGGGGTGSCLTCYFSCAVACDTNFQCP